MPRPKTVKEKGFMLYAESLVLTDVCDGCGLPTIRHRPKRGNWRGELLCFTCKPVLRSDQRPTMHERCGRYTPRDDVAERVEYLARMYDRHFGEYSVSMAPWAEEGRTRRVK